MVQYNENVKIYIIVGIKMSHRKEIIMIYTNGEITNTDKSVTFVYNEIVTILYIFVAKNKKIERKSTWISSNHGITG